MSFDEIQFSATAIADMYGNLLVCLPQEPVQPATVNPEPVVPAIKYLGENKKNVTVLVNYANEEYMPDSQLAFVRNIFKACDLDINDLAIVNTALLQSDLQALKTQLKPGVMMVFGTHTGINVPVDELFTPVKMEDTMLVSAPELEKLNRQDTDSRLLKSRLWITLKQLFNV